MPKKLWPVYWTHVFRQQVSDETPVVPFRPPDVKCPSQAMNGKPPQIQWSSTKLCGLTKVVTSEEGVLIKGTNRILCVQTDSLLNWVLKQSSVGTTVLLFVDEKPAG
ncbi:hypothetical protein T265_05388 [Opisthorchis viverrini]|uniref:Uncharacterized protein n=1 Tax=Opisthorchis viverrini TaxID=6198 RepID=A0A074ZW27_OPIVI|nr:hypothetical protein T265_05388 [Opisthorchis viverrini]KER27570.1 hypothetical protein T265_05388 [Opisthorchis viverrini]